MGDVGHELAALRSSGGISQGRLAELSGVSKATISRIESGQQTPTRATFELLAKALKISRTQQRAMFRDIALQEQQISGQDRFNRLVAEHQELIANYERIAQRVLDLNTNLERLEGMLERVITRFDGADESD